MLPVEIVNKVVSSAYNSTNGVATVKSTALVCRQWKAVSDPYLYRRVSIVSQASLRKLERFLKDNITIARYSRALIMRPQYEDNMYAPTAWVAGIAATLPSLAENLHTIEFDHLYELGDYFGTEFMTDFSKYTSVRILILKDCSVDLHVLFSLTSALPALRHLTCDSMTPLQGTGTQDLPRLHEPRLESLALNFPSVFLDCMAQFMEFLLETETPRVIRTLRLVVRLQGSQSVGQFISAAAHELIELELELDRFLQLPAETSGAFSSHLWRRNCYGRG